MKLFKYLYVLSFFIPTILFSQVTLPTLPSATGPLIGTDILLCREGADTSDNKCTVNQLKAAIATGTLTSVQSISAKSDGTGILTLDGDTATTGNVAVQPNGVLLLNYNGTTTGVRLYRSGSILVVTNGDDSAYLDLAAGGITATGNALVAGDIVITAAGGDIIIEGDTADDNEATLTVGPLTADRTITLPDASGTVVLQGNLTQKKCIIVEDPTSGDNLLMFNASSIITVTGIDCLSADGTSVAATLNECDANGANCVSIESAITCGTTNSTESGAIDNATVDAGDWVRLSLGTNTGSVTQLAVCLEYLQ